MAVIEKTMYLECECKTPEHLIKVTFDNWNGYPFFCMELLLNHYLSFFKRIWIAFKYVFKMRSMDCHFDTVILSSEQVNELKRVLNTYKVYDELNKVKLEGKPERPQDLS